MGYPAPHKKVKLIIGFIFNDEVIRRRAESMIVKIFGAIDLHSRIIDFSQTAYYEQEFGKNLKRKFISLERLVNPENIYRNKLITNDIERRLSKSGKRTINIDPGYITQGKLVLLTTKDHVHRVYLRAGIFAESTLRFQHGTYLPWKTAYPDYRSNAYIEIFKKIRNLYKKQLPGE